MPWRNQGGTNAQAPPPMYQQEVKPRPYVPPRGNSYQPLQADDQDDVKSMLKQLIEGQAKAQQENKERIDKLERKMDTSHGESQAKFEQVFSHLKMLDGQIAQITASSSRPAGSFPGKPEKNPRENCHVITTNSKCDDEIDEIARLLYGDGQEYENWVLECQLEDSRRNAKKVIAVVDPQIPEDCNVVKSVKRDIVDVVIEQDTKKVAVVEPPSYVPPLPFPSRCLTKAQRKMLSRFKEDMSKIGVPISNMGNLHVVRDQIDFIRAVLRNREVVEELLPKKGDPDPAPLEVSVLSKQPDQGTFVIPCTLGNHMFDDALCDTGASVNVLSHEVVKLIGADVMKESAMTLSFGDASTKQPTGKIIDYPLKISNCTIPTDFIVVEMEPGCEIPFILGRPFLHTVGAAIDFVNKEVVLKRVNSKVSYPIKEQMSSICGLISIKEIENTADTQLYLDHRDTQSHVTSSKDALVEKSPLTDPMTV